MSTSTIRTKLLPFGVTGALAIAVLAGAGFSNNVAAKPSPDKTAAAAQAALAGGQVDKAIQLAETLVAASPREASYRALLAHAYLKAGRFESAATTFDNAMELGDNTGKTALGLALSYAGAGRNRDAVAILDDWRDAIPVTDLGLALALAGEPTRGSAVLADALRNGENSAKLRQNLAYAYALDGRWREARIMISQDVPADQIDARISDWAAKTRPEDYNVRVAGLLNAPVRTDPGQPMRLALNANPVNEQLAVQTTQAGPASQLAVADAPPVELPPVTAPALVPAPASAPRNVGSGMFARAFAEPAAQPPARPVKAARVALAAPQMARLHSARPSMASRSAVVAKPKSTAHRRSANAAPVSMAARGTHVIQLGSFFTKQGARRAWRVYAAKNPELRNYHMAISQAKVRGKIYFRVAAAGINGGLNARGLCGAVKARGMTCFAMASRVTLPHASKPAKAPQMDRAKAMPGGPALARKR